MCLNILSLMERTGIGRKGRISRNQTAYIFFHSLNNKSYYFEILKIAQAIVWGNKSYV